MNKQSLRSNNLNDLKIINHQSSIINHQSIPIQYQKGYVEFYKLKFKVTPDVLIPRPETELLVDEVLKSITQLPTTVLDLGTGAGNIAISIAKNTPDVKIIATDISSKALKIAQENAKLHRVENQIKFIQSNLLSNCNLSPITCTLIIVTNLPYIPKARIPYLDSSVKDFEPHVALDGGEDGFELYRELFKQIQDKGWKPKLIIGEIDYTHGELAANEGQKYFPKARVEVKKDLAYKQRILTIQF
ncbi:peptide chain release factor N(5)-glutamine methyltransferase [Patescibacteria group bacterium]|nr:peptide chain release factor N(5)-glutamine methyltransferase [Patescibacteria group bacterium]